MKVYFLGTNGWFDTKTGNTVCVLVETKSEYVIFDAGNGLTKIASLIKQDKPVYLFLSHYHFDHIIGFHALNKFSFRQGIDVYGPPGLKLLFKRVMNKPYTIPLAKLKTKIRLHEIANLRVLPAGIECKPLRHSIVCYGYRLVAENKILTYCTDTGLCNNLYSLAKDADLFIAECSYLAGQNDAHWPHLNPESAGCAALKAGAKKLALIHFDANLYLNFRQRDEAVKKCRKIFKSTFACRDNLIMEL